MASNAMMATLDRVCDEAVTTNHIAVVLTVCGGLSLLACIPVILVIVAYKKDKAQLRERVLLGLFWWNLVYSVANVSPRYYVEDSITTPLTCMYPRIGLKPALTLATMWMASKYSLLSYEVFAIVVSILGLKSQGKIIGLKVEIFVHVICNAAFGLVFGLYFHLGLSDLTTFDNCASLCSEADQVCVAECAQTLLIRDYNNQTANFMEVWLALLGCALLLWGYFRYIVYYFDQQWAQRETETIRQINRDLWDDWQKPDRDRKIKVLQLQMQRYIEIAQPLERYVVVFLLFGIPALVMAISSEPLTVIACEVVLSLRALGSVIVYFSNNDSRAELFNSSQLCKRLGNRVRGCFVCCSIVQDDGVTFARHVTFNDGDALPLVSTHNQGGDCQTETDDDNEVVGATIPYEPLNESVTT
eukprot:m.51401 g.51401  ORF g.51401 m.51401 type:complete len:415 (+) comp21439_c0_seq1:395-1639(+)